MPYSPKIRWVVLGMVCSASMVWAAAQTPAGTSASCPTAETLKTEQLYGRWQVEWRSPPQGLPTYATLVLARHEEFSESLAGVLSRTVTPLEAKTLGLTQKAAIAGDWEAGFLLLDESSDNVRITATWNGEMVPGSCGKVFQGTWTDTRHAPQTEKPAAAVTPEGASVEDEVRKAAEPEPLAVPFTLTRLN